MTFVPHILINGNHVSHLEFEQSIICSEYCGEKPEVCIEKYSSSQKRIFSSSLSLAIAFLMPKIFDVLSSKIFLTVIANSI